MKLFIERNVHQILPLALSYMSAMGSERGSRNGKVLQAKMPVTSCYKRPAERVVFWPKRDANPFFHFFESLWMLAGRNDVGFPARFVKRMRSFSDDGKTLHGAYGYRWRVAFGFDQIGHVIEALRRDPLSRRQVVQMWDAAADLRLNGKDLPCNLIVTFQIDIAGRLEMCVFNRSNDAIWGCYGANAVHFSFLHEYVAAGVGVPLGRYYQISHNFHVYRNVFDEMWPFPELEALDEDNMYAHVTNTCPYVSGEVEPFPLLGPQEDLKTWQEDLAMFLEHPDAVGFRTSFFRRVAIPLWYTHRAMATLEGEKRYMVAHENLSNCKATDWQKAAREWINRRAMAEGR